MKPNVRPCTAMDAVNIVRLIHSNYNDGPACLLAPFDDQRMLEYVTKLTPRAFCLVYEQNRRILGSIALMPLQLPWCEPSLFMEAWFCFNPKAREKGVPAELLDAAEEFLDRVQKTVVMGTNVLCPSSEANMLLERGYDPLGGTWYRRPTPRESRATA